MDLRQSSSNESGNIGSFSITSIISSVVSAILEWILMFMIFVDSSFAYLVTRFAHRSQLQIPCLLCSRLDHFLGNEREGFYWDLICNHHKSKLSSLVLCQLHKSKYEAREITNESSQVGRLQDKDSDPLPHVEYSQIKVVSDAESDGPFSDNGSGSALIQASGQDSAAQYDISEPQITTLADFPPTEKLIHLASPFKTSLSESDDRTYSHHNVESEPSVGHGQADHNDDASKPSELASSHSVHPSSNDNDTHYVESNKTNDTSTPELEKEVPVDSEEASNLENDSIPSNEINMDSKPYKTGTSSQMTESLELGDAYNLALGTRGRQLSGRLLEQQRSMTESTRASEDLKLLLSQLSFARNLDISSDMSPKVSISSEDSKAMQAYGAQIFQRRISLERNESNISIDGSIVSEIDGESELDRLKRQVEHDKKILVSLYKELEEERNASAIATNQAMAMITRLQEEKAAFHMEALQCVRMMEEQAEYDSEALQKANEMVMEKEKQIQDFEIELEMYRNQRSDVPLLNGPRPESESDELKDIVKRIDVETKMLDGDDTVRISLHQFEDEKQYILECLKKLEEKISISNKGSEGFELIGEIAFRLQEMHSAHIVEEMKS